MDLSDLTIVILSRGREEFLRKSLEFWSSHMISVVVIHNTDHPLNTKDFSERIIYRVDKGSFGERCSLVPELLGTKFAILSSDDELFLPSGLLAMKLALEGDSSLASVGGRTLAVGKYGSLTTGSNPYSNMNQYSNKGETPLERIYNHYNPNAGNRIGGVYRLMYSTSMDQVMKIFARVSNVKTPSIFEVTGEILVNSQGMCEYIPNVYWLRNWINVPVQHGNWDRKLQFSMWATSGEYALELAEWKKIIQEDVGLSAIEIETVLERVISVRQTGERAEALGKRQLASRIPATVKGKIRKIFAPTSLPSAVGTILDDMKNQGAIFDSNEIRTAIKAIS